MNIVDVEEKLAKNTHLMDALKREMDEFRLKVAKMQDDIAWLKEHVVVRSPDD